MTDRTKKFIKWLEQNGAEILPVTNLYESVRFKGSEVGVVYRSGKFSGEYAEDAWKCYASGKAWNGRPVSVGRSGSYAKQKKAILKRDGCNCFYCDEPLEDDITLEHLVSLASGGKDTIGNMVLAHGKCNQMAGNKPVIEKVKIAIAMRKNKYGNCLLESKQ